MLRLDIQQIAEPWTRDNFRRIEREVRSQPLLRGQWRFFELGFPAAVTNARVTHGLPFVPKDVLVTSVRGGGAASFNFDLFDATFLDITTTGPATIRAFVGSFVEDSDA
jgi:hypothetical protein